jgi:excisionase family DNA binding protein
MAHARRSRASSSPDGDPEAEPTIDQREVLNAKQVAKLLGVHLSTVYEAANLGRIPHRRLGRLLLFERSAVLDWVRGEN